MASSTTRSGAGRRRSSVHEDPRQYSADRIVYVESSALLSAILEEDAGVLAILGQPARRVTSALTFAECLRALVRARATNRITAASETLAVRAILTFQRRCECIPISADVLERAGRAFPVEPARTLDAIHLASLELLGLPRDEVTVMTRDHRLGENVQRLGYIVA